MFWAITLGLRWRTNLRRQNISAILLALWAGILFTGIYLFTEAGEQNLIEELGTMQTLLLSLPLTALFYLFGYRIFRLGFSQIDAQQMPKPGDP